MRRSQLKFTLEDLAAPSCPSLTPFKSPAHTVVVEVVPHDRHDGPR